MAATEKVVILSGARTPVGSYRSAFQSVPAHELGATASLGALERSGIATQQVDEVVMSWAVR